MNAKAQEASRILNSELFQEVIASLRQSLKDQWEAEPSAAGRETLHHTLRAVPMVVSQLKKIRDQGVVEEHNNRNR